MLGSSAVPLSQAYDLAVLDLDGVVYVGPSAVPGAPDHLDRARAAGMRLAFVTNNAARTPHQVAEHLRELGVHAEDADVVTSAQAAARVLAESLPAAAAVFVIGGPGLERALEEQGLRPVTTPDVEPVAVAQGYGPDMPWRRVVDGAILVRSGVPWVASNTDGSIPTARGIGPGNGTLVDLVARFAERAPIVAGKPQPPLFEETAIRVGGRRPLVVGDRLDTDILGAHQVGWDSLVVLTGVTDLDALVRARGPERPTYIAADLAGLEQVHRAPEQDGRSTTLGGWTVHDHDGELSVAGDGAEDDWWRAVAVAAWDHLDRAEEPADVAALRPGTASTH